MTAVVIVAFLAIVLGIPTWLGLRSGHALTAGTHPDRCGITPPGRLIDGGRVMDPDRLSRAVD